MPHFATSRSKAHINPEQALLLQSRTARLERPSPAALEACHTALLGPEGYDAKLSGEAQRMFDREYEHDLVALAPSIATHMLSQFLKNHWMFLAKPEEVSQSPCFAW